MQKISIRNDFGTRFARVERTERDRPGGHHPTPVLCEYYGGEAFMRPGGRKFCKRVFAKLARREHARIVREALREYEFQYDFYLDTMDEAAAWHRGREAQQRAEAEEDYYREMSEYYFERDSRDIDDDWYYDRGGDYDDTVEISTEHYLMLQEKAQAYDELVREQRDSERGSHYAYSRQSFGAYHG